MPDWKRLVHRLRKSGSTAGCTRSQRGTVPLSVVTGIGGLVFVVLATTVAARVRLEATAPTAWVAAPAPPLSSIQMATPLQATVNVAPVARAYSGSAAAPVRIGNWTPERGRVIAQRALAWVGWPYSFAAGNAAGPTFGVAVDEASRNDGSVRGFDCSGLVLFALAPWKRVDHFAASQYLQAGSMHPSLKSLLPGDLIFWSKDGTVGGVGHVAVYIGGGNVVQAPQSGQLVTVTRIDQVEPGTIGTTRPLT